MSVQSALDEFERILRTRVTEVVDEDYYVQSRFGKTTDWDDEREGTRFLWRRLGFDPDLELPRPQLSDPAPSNNSWRTSVAFDDQSVEYWFRENTAIFFADLSWGSLGEGAAQISPSLGNEQPFGYGLDFGGLIGAFRVIVSRPGFTSVKALPDGRRIDIDDWEIINLWPNEPLWERLSQRHGRRPSISDIPSTYIDDFNVEQSAFESREECLGALLPDDLRSPYFMNIGSAVAYSLGWLSLVHGLRFVVDNWRSINEVLHHADLPLFVPSNGHSNAAGAPAVDPAPDIARATDMTGYQGFVLDQSDSVVGQFTTVDMSELGHAPGIYRVFGASWILIDEDGDAIEEGSLEQDWHSLICLSDDVKSLAFESHVSDEAWLGLAPAQNTAPIDVIALGLTGGRYLVGHDIEPGDYYLPFDGDSSKPLFRRLDRDLKEIHESRFTEKDATRREVTIYPDDFAIEFSGRLRRSAK